MDSRNRQTQATCTTENLDVASLNGGTRTNCRRKCNLITFKGTNQDPNLVPERLEMKQAINQVDFGGKIFNIVPQDTGDLHANENLRPIKPIDESNVQELHDDARPKEPFKFAGYLATILASLSNSISLLLVKLLPVEDNLQEKSKAIMFRGFSIMLFCCITIVHRGYSFKIHRGEYWLNFFRAISGSSSLILTYASLMFITLGESQTIVNASCVWTCLLSSFTLDEKLQPSLIVAVPMSLLGIILLAEPDLILDTTSEVPVHHLEFNKTHQVFEMIGNATTLMDDDDSDDDDFFRHRLPGFAAALAASLTWSITTIILKFRKKTPIVTCTFYHGLGQIVLGLVIQSVVGFASLPSTALEWSLQAGIGLSSFLNQNLFQWGLLYVPAGTYSVIRTLDIPFSFLLGAIFLDELILWTSVAGSLLIMAVVAMLVFNDQLVRGLKTICRRSSRNTCSES